MYIKMNMDNKLKSLIALGNAFKKINGESVTKAAVLLSLKKALKRNDSS